MSYISISDVVKVQKADLFVFFMCIILPSTLMSQPWLYHPDIPQARVETYKLVGDTKLQLWIFTLKAHREGDQRPAIIFFFGGSWRYGSPIQFAKHCEYLATRGMVAMTADYRVIDRH
ncbi:MAG: hypothetical protein ACE5HS_12190 [bacterium]